jgi:hypothetical protein
VTSALPVLLRAASNDPRRSPASPSG